MHKKSLNIWPVRQNKNKYSENNNTINMVLINSANHDVILWFLVNEPTD